MLRDGYEMRDVVLAALRRERIEPQVAIEGGELDAVLGFVEAGLGIAVVPSMVVEGRPELRRIPFVPPGMSRTVGIAHRRDVDPSATAQAFRSVLFEHLADRSVRRSPTRRRDHRPRLGTRLRPRITTRPIVIRQGVERAHKCRYGCPGSRRVARARLAAVVCDLFNVA